MLIENASYPHQAVVVFVKAPRPGAVKTRLAQDLGAEAAAEVYRCFVADTVALISSLEEAQPYLAYTPDDGQAEVQDLVDSLPRREPAPMDLRFFPQRGTDLGERMTAAVEEAWSQGHTHVVLLGSDSPHLPWAWVREALVALGQNDMVLGPTSDGGYYLLATRRSLGRLLHGMTWSTAQVLAQTRQRAEAAGWSVALLPEGYDVDTLSDLQRLYEDLCAWDGPEADHPCPQTWDWLRRKMICDTWA